jgi:hypothetical protein
VHGAVAEVVAVDGCLWRDAHIDNRVLRGGNLNQNWITVWAPKGKGIGIGITYTCSRRWRSVEGRGHGQQSVTRNES